MTTLRAPRPLAPEAPEAWIIDQPSASIEPPRPWAELPMPMWDERNAPAPQEETAPTGGTVVIFDI